MWHYAMMRVVSSLVVIPRRSDFQVKWRIMKISFFTYLSILSLLFVISATPHANANIPSGYLKNGQFHPVMLVSGVASNGTVSVPSYKGNDGAWHDTVPFFQICGLDSAGDPQACPQVNVDNFLQTASLNSPSGVAGLDATGTLTQPIATSALTVSSQFRLAPMRTHKWLSTLSNSAQVGGYSVARGNNSLLATYSGGQVTDWASPPEQMRFGGSQEYDSVPINEHCFPYSWGNMGTCAQFMMGSQNVQGQAAGIGPSSAAQIPNYDNFDAAGIVQQAGGATPYFTATAATATNVMPVPSDGLDHTPSFTATGATFANPLPADASAWIVAHPQVRLMTNEIGCVKCAISTYVGTMQTAQTNSAGLVTGITVDGWRVFGSGDSDSNQVPGQTTTDGSTPTLDTTWTKFGAPALMFGVYTKAFNHYTLCSAPGPSPTAAPGDINYPTGNRNQQLRDCEAWEADLWNYDPTGQSIIHGQTVVFTKQSGAAEQPAAGSYNYYSAGPNLVGYQASGEYFTQPFSSQSYRVNGYGGPTYNAGDTQVMADWTMCDRAGYECDGGWPRHTVRPTIWNTRNVAADTNGKTGEDPTGSWAHITTNIGVQVDGNSSQGTAPAMDGTVQEHIELNPKSNGTGIGLCNYGQTDTTCGLILDGTGVVHATKSSQTPAAKVSRADGLHASSRMSVRGSGTSAATIPITPSGAAEDGSNYIGPLSNAGGALGVMISGDLACVDGYDAAHWRLKGIWMAYAGSSQVVLPADGGNNGNAKTQKPDDSTSSTSSAWVLTYGRDLAHNNVTLSVTLPSQASGAPAVNCTGNVTYSAMDR